MKTVFIAGMALLAIACSTHRVRCRGALQPINKAAPAAVRQNGGARESRP